MDEEINKNCCHTVESYIIISNIGNVVLYFSLWIFFPRIKFTKPWLGIEITPIPSQILEKLQHITLNKRKTQKCTV